MKSLLLLFALCLTTSAALSATYSPLGYWKTISSETHEPRSIVLISQTDQQCLSGHVLMGFPHADGTKPFPYCTECSDKLTNKRIDGIELLWAYRQDGNDPNRWIKGKVLDPEDGKIYHSTISMENEDTLVIRGYIGLPIIGRSQTWQRVTQQQYQDFLKKYPQPDIPEDMPASFPQQWETLQKAQVLTQTQSE